MESATADLPLAVGPAIIMMLFMEFVVTLITKPTDSARIVAESMAEALLAQGIAVEKTHSINHWASDVYVQHDALETLNAFVQKTANEQCDAIVQAVARRRKKLLIADMESTIITCECLDELAELVGIKDKIAGITARAMNGEIKFEEALRERVGLLKDLPESALQRVYDEKVRLMPGAKELLTALKRQGVYTMLVSGGFDFYTSRIAALLGFDEHRSNRLEIKDGKLTGKVIEPILGREAKLRALLEGCSKLGIGPEDAMAVGDGANDLPMLLAAGLGVAYYAKPNVRAQAKARIDHGDLKALIYVQGIST